MKHEIPEQNILEAVEKGRLAREERKKNPPPRLIHLQQTTSLQEWIHRCKKADVPYIPAKFCPVVISLEDIFAAIDGKEVPENIGIVEKWLKFEWERWKEFSGTHSMWRWDICAPSSIKSAMAHSEEYEAEPSLEIDDPRFIDILYETHRDNVSVCVRPWVKAEYYEGYPVEFRVFAFRDGYNNEYAVSNYYPQRDLPEEYYPYAVECEKLASKLSQTENFENGFTADFLLTENRELLFIEGGPAWGYGADPCCIDPEKMDERRIVLVNEFKRG